jgi:FMN-dependent NADH-azoreductase
MINFGIPSSLKAYIDYVVRPGVTFCYGNNGPEGLIKGKKAYLVVARGGDYTQSPTQAFNFQDTYLKAVLGFIGITDVEVTAVEGITLGPEVAEKNSMRPWPGWRQFRLECASECLPVFSAALAATAA